MKEFYKTKEEMKKDIKKLRKETLAEMYDLKKQRQKELANKIVKLIVIIAILITIFKVFVGTIVITYNYPRNRLYTLTLNDTKVTIDVVETKTIHIVPFIIDLKLYSSKMFYGDDFSSVINIKQGSPCIIDIKSYKCFVVMHNTKTQSGCDSEVDTINELTSDTHYNLLISEAVANGKVIYDGEYINAISSYLTKKEDYYVEITGKYHSTESKIVFWISVQ